ncbi:MAG: cyclodeaminase/cyclohydrolase family protein [Chloroflexi bacterium]|nr:cyclodeaminase/cyclohydrolase family protein [Chloroflexota bacterium]
MTDRFVDLSLRAFSDELASGSAVPGGGSAAAYAGALGAALAAMVGRIAAKKKDGSGSDTEFIAELDDLRAYFLRLVDDDSAAFRRVSEAMRLPKSTDAEKAARKERLQAGLTGASRVPLEVAKAARRLLDACERGLKTASPMTVSDIGVAALMAEAALRGAALNVMTNLASISDAAQIKSLSEDLDRALDGSEEQRKRILDFVESRIAR